MGGARKGGKGGKGKDMKGKQEKRGGNDEDGGGR